MPNDYEIARKARGTPKTSMTIEASKPGDPNPVEKKTDAKPGSQEFLNKENDYDKNTYTPEQLIHNKSYTLVRS